MCGAADESYDKSCAVGEFRRGHAGSPAKVNSIHTRESIEEAA
jgi:hypothetical protein